MPEEPISSSGITPASPTPSYGPNAPRLGAGEEAEPQKPFSLSPEGGKTAPGEKTDLPSPMEVANDAAGRGQQLSPEDLQDHISKLQGTLKTFQTQLQDSGVTSRMTQDHYEAMTRLTEKMNPNMQAIAKNSKGEFQPPQLSPGADKALNYVTQWLNGSQGTLTHALNYLQTTKKPDITSYLKLQYHVQMATQRGELFASIVGATVSGIKTLMSTQIG